MAITIYNDIITEWEYNQTREESVLQLQKNYPNINVENLIKEIWVFPEGIPFFYLEIESDFCGGY